MIWNGMYYVDYWDVILDLVLLDICFHLFSWYSYVGVFWPTWFLQGDTLHMVQAYFHVSTIIVGLDGLRRHLPQNYQIFFILHTPFI